MGYRFNTNKVRGLLTENSMNQEDLAKLIGTTAMTVRNKLSGRTKFTEDEICLMASCFKVPPAIFFEQLVSITEKK